jgi:hypothetical protein
MRPLAILLLLACAACASAGSQPSAPVPAKPAAAAPPATLAQIQALVGTPSCSSDSQCHSLAVGAKPCGGPEAYLAWSSAHTNPEKIRALGERYAAERKAEGTRRGMVSDCRFQLDPGAQCRAGVCQLGGGDPVAR